MSRSLKLSVFYVTAFLIVSGSVMAAEPNTASAKPDPFKMNKTAWSWSEHRQRTRAPTEGAWGVVIKEEYFDIIKQAGFNSVRLPVSWSGHALIEKPYTINPEFFKRVDTIINWAVSRNMPIIVNIHQYTETYDEPLAQKERFLALWRQIAEHYKNYPDILLFEPMNEPKRKLTPAIWNDYIKGFLAVIRESNPNRTVVIGSARDSWITYLKLLELPENDRNIIVTVHHYFPHAFTHQSTPWMNPEKVAKTLADMKFIGQDPNSNGVNDYNAWPGTKWMGTPQEKKYMTDIFDLAPHGVRSIIARLTWVSSAHTIKPIWNPPPLDEVHRRYRGRARYELNVLGILRQEFGLYDRDAKSWRKPLLEAIIPSKQ